MGSLPNLNELGKSSGRSNPCHRTAFPIEGNSSYFTEDVRFKIGYRNSLQEKLPRVVSNGNGFRNIYDDLSVEHMAAYSPISSRSIRNLTSVIKRKDSINSSIGANSVRRLIGVVKNVHHRCNPLYSRRTLIRNMVILCIVHLIMTITLFPFLTLQGSVSLMSISAEDQLNASVKVGPLFLMFVFILSAFTVLIAPAFIHFLGTKIIFVISYFIFALFYTVHVYPTLYTMIPVYILLGIILGPLQLSHVSFLLTLSSKLSYTLSDEDEECGKSSKKTAVIRRMARGFRATQDFGLILGSLVAAIFLIFSSADPNSSSLSVQNATSNCSQYFDSFLCLDCFSKNLSYVQNCSYCRNIQNNLTINCSNTIATEESIVATTSDIYNYIFETDEIGERICGVSSCPSNFESMDNITEVGKNPFVEQNTLVILMCIFGTLSAMAVVLIAVGIDKIKSYVCQDPTEHFQIFSVLHTVGDTFKDTKLQFAAPLAFFIGLEQAFMFTDFSKSYVICTIGIQRVNVVFMSMGFLQSIAACTLSMLLRTIRRYYVVGVGFTFHSCLLMVLMLWKPMSDDPALFYVISAAWGVCNAIWEILSFSLLTGIYSDNWEAPFANTLFFKFLGFSVAFGFHDLLCNWSKLYILAVVLVISVVLFAWLEIRLESIRKTKNVNRL